MEEDTHRITRLLMSWREGNLAAANQLMELVYGELHGMAARLMRREPREHTLQATALVHELYLRMCGSGPVSWQDRAHFFAVAARQLRRVLVDHARRFRSDKRGGRWMRVTLMDFDGSAMDINEKLLAVDEALTQLEALDERAARAVELRFFGGLSEADAAEALHVSIATLKRDWDFARAWLISRLI